MTQPPHEIVEAVVIAMMNEVVRLGGVPTTIQVMKFGVCELPDGRLQHVIYLDIRSRTFSTSEAANAYVGRIFDCINDPRFEVPGYTYDFLSLGTGDIKRLRGLSEYRINLNFYIVTKAITNHQQGQ